MSPCIFRRFFHLPVSVFAALLAVGCASTTTPNLDARFGEAVLQARALQTINPDFPANPDPVYGLDGESARQAMIRYQESFKTPPSTFNVINIGGQ